jgi:hypothetical protein
VQQEALEKRRDARLKVYAVWFEMIAGDARPRWPSALLSDPRVEHFWDAERLVGGWYGSHVDYGNGSGVWWDVWLLYGPDAEWTDEPSHRIGHGRTIIGSREQLRSRLVEVLGARQDGRSTPSTLETTRARR